MDSLFSLLLAVVQISSVGQQVNPVHQNKLPLAELKGYTQVVYCSPGN